MSSGSLPSTPRDGYDADMPTYEPVGLDLSLTSTGIAIGNATWTIEAKKLTGTERLIHLRNEIINALKDFSDNLHPVNPLLVVIEGYSFASRNSHAHALGELGGVVRVALTESNWNFVEVPPTCRAKFATGRGNAGKSEVVSAISARTGIVWSGSGSDDRCDAWILQEMAFAHYGQSRYKWPDSHTSVLSKIDWP